MFMISTRKIRSFEFGLVFKDGEFQRVLAPGRHWFIDPLNRKRVDVVNRRAPWFAHNDLDILVKAGVLKDRAEVIDLRDNERALVWIDNRFARVLRPGLHAIWTGFRDVRVERVRVERARFIHNDLHTILKSPDVTDALDVFQVEDGHEGIFFLDGEYQETLKPGCHAFWKGVGKVKVYNVDQRETVLDIGGQEIMSADKVSLRLNAVVIYKVVDAHKAVTVAEDVKQALYRDAQLALRAVIGARSLDALLTDKETVAADLEHELHDRTNAFGIKIIALGIRDVILPGEMKDLLNRVTEARKAAEANLITRREETAAMRSQANTARMLENNPTLMRLRELEVLQAVAGNARMKVVLGEKGLADRVMSLL